MDYFLCGNSKVKDRLTPSTAVIDGKQDASKSKYGTVYHYLSNTVLAKRLVKRLVLTLKQISYHSEIFF